MSNQIDLVLESKKQTNKEILTKQDLMAHLESLPDNTPIRVSVSIDDIVRAKKTVKRTKNELEFELSGDIDQNDAGLLVSAWVHPMRLPTEQKRITGTLLVEREVGMVKWFNDAKGLGFIVRDQGEDVFVHYEAIRGSGYRCLKSGSQVEYSLYKTNKGLQAQDVVQIAPPPMENSYFTMT